MEMVNANRAQMPIWSLTKERIEKLLKQIGDREDEIDTLIKLTKEDLWNNDLDAFINEWRFQLEDEAKTRKKAAQMGRRASSKLKVDAKRPAAKKGKASKTKKAESDDEDEEIFRPATTRKPPAAAKKTESVDEDEEVVRPAISRKPRAAAKKIPTYNLSDSDSNGDDLLFDVGKMVKGIDNAPADQSASNRPLFSASMSRPGSSAGLGKKSSSSARQTIDVDDDTDYSKLAPPQASKRGASVTARSMVISDDDMDDEDAFRTHVPSPPPKALKAPRAPKSTTAKATISKPATTKAIEPKTAASKPAKAKAPAAAAAKKTTLSLIQEPKKMPLSPAAKAYAAKKARTAARVLDDEENDDNGDDEVEKVVNEIMDEGEGSVASDADDDDDDLVVRRPARKAAAQAAEKGKKGWGLESEDEDFEEDDSE